MARIAVVGPGSIGCTMLGWLGQRPQHALTACGRTPFDQVEIETPDGVITAAPTVITSLREAPMVDWVLLTTKAYDAGPAGRWLDRLVGPDTRVAVLQNGVDHLVPFETRIPRERLVPVVVECPAERLSPGRVHQRAPGWMLVPDSEAGRDFAGLFSGTAIEVRLSSDWLTAAWRKLCLNAAGAVSAVTLIPSGIVHEDAIADIMRGIVREVVAVGRAVGAQLDDESVEAVITHYRNAPRDGINSMHADRLAGRPMEIDARNGVIVRLGRKFGIATPYNETIVALLRATTSGSGTIKPPETGS